VFGLRERERVRNFGSCWKMALSLSTSSSLCVPFVVLFSPAMNAMFVRAARGVRPTDRARHVEDAHARPKMPHANAITPKSQSSSTNSPPSIREGERGELERKFLLHGWQ